MNTLFVHQNFPGQFGRLAAALASRPNAKVVALGQAHNIANRPNRHPGVTVFGYADPKPINPSTHPYIRDYEQGIRRGQRVAEACMQLKTQGFSPELIVAHPAWGEALFLDEIFPYARHIHYYEFFYRTNGADVGFDPEYADTLDDRLRVRVRNAMQLISLGASHAGISPTHWQRSLYPAEWQDKISVCHEGIDTDALCPKETSQLELGGRRFSADDELVTYVARNLEPYRGFHVFMRTLPQILARRPKAQILIIGGDGVSYGRTPTDGSTYRDRLSQELGDSVDWSRIHFLGRLPYAQYVEALRVSSAHVYLTYPFVLSWSMLEAMSCGCLVIGSATPPVQEVIRHNENGLLVDFFDTNALAEHVTDALANPAGYHHLRLCARETILAEFDLRTKCLPKLEALLLQTVC